MHNSWRRIRAWLMFSFKTWSLLYYMISIFIPGVSWNRSLDVHTFKWNNCTSVIQVTVHTGYTIRHYVSQYYRNTQYIVIQLFTRYHMHVMMNFNSKFITIQWLNFYTRAWEIHWELKVQQRTYICSVWCLSDTIYVDYDVYQTCYIYSWKTILIQGIGKGKW